MEQQDIIRVLIVDDHQVVRGGLRFYLSTTSDIEVVGEADCGEQAVELCDQLLPDVVMVDMVMPGMNGWETTQAIRSKHPSIQVLVMSGYADSTLVQNALKAGAAGYLLKDTGTSELLNAIRAAKTGLQTFAPRAMQALLTIDDERVNSSSDQAANPQPAIDTTSNGMLDMLETEMDMYYALTRRERQIFKFVLLGYTSAEIGYWLYISPRTAEKHRANMMHKLGVRNQIELSRLAHRLKIMPSEEEVSSSLSRNGEPKLDFMSFGVRDRSARV
jgi:NarL family two-component system response regulator LiaR